MKLWPWSKKTTYCPEEVCDTGPSAEAVQALEDSKLIRETADLRWKRVDETVERAMNADRMVRHQRDQNHLGEIAWHALHAKYGGKPA